jgi:two-component system LytT family response regulator
MTLFASVDAGIRIVLVTAHDDRALEAFDAGAFDYLLKPVTAARLQKTVDRLRHATTRRPSPVPPVPDERERLTVSTPTGTVLLPAERVLWIEARQNYSLIHRADGGPLLVKRLLGDFGEELPSRRFARIGRSLVINLGKLRTVSRVQGHGALLEFAESNETLVIGRAATARLRQLLAPQPESPPR